ncbi:MAG: hypothetical protein M3R53_07910 [Candidatus Eremiobacteraeota bacterium]|nr:hypothetical protein [Candidatus Eremiobacteraeota bacterium]
MASYACLLLAPALCDGRLPPQEYGVLTRYLTALQAHRYAQAFDLLSNGERIYFGSAANFASAYSADKLALRSFRIVASEPAAGGMLVYVFERVVFYEYSHRAAVSMQAKVAYAIVGSPGRPRVKDPNHPWRALAPQNRSVTSGGVRVTLDKLSFFTGRLELVITFSNIGDGIVTLLPYGKSVVRDEAGRTYLPIESRSNAVTDIALFEGLRLPANARYTGAISFATPNRFSPKVLTVTFAPALRDGAGTPFEMTLPAFDLPSRNGGPR